MEHRCVVKVDCACACCCCWDSSSSATANSISWSGGALGRRLQARLRLLLLLLLLLLELIVPFMVWFGFALLWFKIDSSLPPQMFSSWMLFGSDGFWKHKTSN